MTKSYYYRALKKTGNKFVHVKSADYITPWADEIFVDNFEKQLHKYFNKIKGDVEIDGASFNDCDIHQPNKLIEDFLYIKVNSDGIPYDKVTEYNGNVNLPVLEQICSSVKNSENYYHNYYTSLENNYLFPYCQFQNHGIQQVLDENLLLSSPNSIVIGPAGSGKTTLVRKLTYDLCSSIVKKRNPHQVVALYFMLRKYTNFKNEFKTLIYEHADNLNNEFINSQRDRGKILIIFDGLDELNPEYRSDFVSWFSDFKKREPSFRVIITSRDIEFISHPIFQAFNKINIQPFYQNQIHEYCHRFLGSKEKASSFYDLIKSNNQLLNLLSNPLTLALSLSLYVYKNMLPYNIGTLIKEIVYLFTENWDEKRNVSRYLKLTPNLSRWLLGKIAHQLQIKDSYTFKSNFIANLLPHEVAQFRPDEILRELAENTGILTVNDKVYSFSHRYFLDFFCAHYLIEKSGGIEYEYLNYGAEKKWLNVWNQAAELSSDPEYYFKKASIRDKDIFYFMDRLFTVLLASEKINLKDLNKATHLIQSNWIKLNNEIEKYNASGKHCSISIISNSTIEPDAFASFIIKIYHLSKTETLKILQQLIKNNGLMINRLIRRVIKLKQSPEYRIEERKIYFKC